MRLTLSPATPRCFHEIFRQSCGQKESGTFRENNAIFDVEGS